MKKAKKARGKGVKPAMVHVTLRVPKEVVAFFTVAGAPPTKLMRDALVEHVEFYSKQR